MHILSEHYNIVYVKNCISHNPFQSNVCLLELENKINKSKLKNTNNT